MSKKMRCLNTKFWSDSYIMELDPSEKLLFIYFLTNEHANLCGMYELPSRIIAFETGFEKEMVERIIKRFSKDGKIYYFEEWVIVKNFLKHQRLNKNMATAAKNELEEVPEKVWLRIKKNPNHSEWLPNHSEWLSNHSENRRESNRIERKKRKELFSLSDFIKKYRKSKERHLNILAEYADERKLKFKTVGQWEEFIERNEEGAKKLEVYSDKQISKAMSKINKATKDYLKEWNLKTLNKFLDQ